MHDVIDQLAALLRAARREPGPDGITRARMWTSIEHRLATAVEVTPAERMPPPPTRPMLELVASRAR